MEAAEWQHSPAAMAAMAEDYEQTIGAMEADEMAVNVGAACLHNRELQGCSGGASKPLFFCSQTASKGASSLLAPPGKLPTNT